MTSTSCGTRSNVKASLTPKRRGRFVENDQYAALAMTAPIGSDPYFVTITSPCGGMRLACNDRVRSGA